MPFNIPTRDRKSLIRLITMEETAFDQFCNALPDLPLTTSFRSASQVLAARLHPIDSNFLRDLLYLVAGMSMAIAASPSTGEEGASEILGLLKDSSEPTENINWEDAKRRITRVIAASAAVRRIRKAAEVLSEYPDRLCVGNSRILTDFRPIFADEKVENPTAGIVVHNLKISCHHGDDMKYYYITLDGDDLLLLQEMLNRAIEKQSALELMLLKSGMNVLTDGGHVH